MRELVLDAGSATGARLVRSHFGTLIPPYVEGKQCTPDPFVSADQEFYRLGSRDRGREVHCGVQDSSGFAGFERALRRVSENASQAGGLARKHIHGHAVAAYGCGVDPWGTILDGEIIDEIAGFEVIGAIEDKLRA